MRISQSGGVLERVENGDIRGGVFTIPDNITSIGDNAFDECTCLSSISIPAGVTSIGDQAFFGCTSLSSINILAGIASIGKGAFFACKSLSSIVIPAGVTNIGNYAFYLCANLSGISIPDSVTSIENGAFSNCIKLSSIVIPTGVTSIGDGVFFGCEGLTRIIIDATTSEAYERIKNLLPPELQQYARSKKAHLMEQSVLQNYRVSSLSLSSSQGRLYVVQDLMKAIDDYQQFPENEDCLQLKKALHAEIPPSLLEDEQEWKQYDDKLMAIGNQWEEKLSEKSEYAIAEEYLRSHQKILQKQPYNKNFYIVQTCQLIDRLCNSLKAGKIEVLDESEQALLKRQKTLLKKIPDSIRLKWGIAPVVVTSVNATFFETKPTALTERKFSVNQPG